MFKRLLLVASAVFAYGSNLTLKANNNFSHTPNNSFRYNYIDYESPSYRLGDYEITQLEHISAGGGQVRFNRIQAVIPYVVFDTLAEYENVFIAVSLYSYNSAVNLNMRIDFYLNGELKHPVIYDMENIPLSMTMLKSLPYTMVDLANNINVFDRFTWETDYGYEVRLTFVVPYTAHTNLPSQWQDEMRNITLFTKRAVGEPSYYDSGYSDGYGDGYYDGYRDGDGWGYKDGYSDGYGDGKDDGYDIGFADAESIADGSWLGSLVFGTVGGIVGFLFALSDFEVLGVSIMSIITLFVAIGIIKLLIKVIK